MSELDRYDVNKWIRKWADEEESNRLLRIENAALKARRVAWLPDELVERLRQRIDEEQYAEGLYVDILAALEPKQ